MRYIFLILLAACSSPDYVTKDGVEFFYDEGVEPYSEAQINAQIDGFVEALSQSKHYPKASVKAILAQVRVYVYNEGIPCFFGTQLCAGTGMDGEVKIRRLACPGKSALAHEIAHNIQQGIYSFLDYNHSETYVWTVADREYPGGCDGN